jgi:hypothetical protein
MTCAGGSGTARPSHDDNGDAPQWFSSNAPIAMNGVGLTCMKRSSWWLGFDLVGTNSSLSGPYLKGFLFQLVAEECYRFYLQEQN